MCFFRFIFYDMYRKLSSKKTHPKNFMCETVIFVTWDLVAWEEDERTYRLVLCCPQGVAFAVTLLSLLLLYSLIEETPGDCDLPAAISSNLNPTRRRLSCPRWLGSCERRIRMLGGEHWVIVFLLFVPVVSLRAASSCCSALRNSSSCRRQCLPRRWMTWSGRHIGRTEVKFLVGCSDADCGGSSAHGAHHVTADLCDSILDSGTAICRANDVVLVGTNVRIGHCAGEDKF